MNEFGDINIDSQLLVTVEEDMIELTNGCICCTLNDGLLNAMHKLLEQRDRIDAVIDLCAIQSVVHKPIGKLSKGFRQRVGMAQALLHEPDVIIMDEPTAGLDPNQIAEVRTALRKIAQEKTILLSTHILQEVQAMASRVILVNEGRLVYDGPVAGLDPQGRGLEAAFHSLTAAPV